MENQADVLAEGPFCPLCKAALSLSDKASASRLTSHCHNTRTSQPSCLSFCCVRLSRSTLPSSFFPQNSALRFGSVALGQPGCRCQKQPWTNIAVRYLGRTISGLPGRSLRCNRNRYPIACNNERTKSSGFVSFDLTRDMISLRFFGVKTSVPLPGDKTESVVSARWSFTT